MVVNRRHLLSTAFAFAGTSALGQSLRPVARPHPFIEGEPIDGWLRPRERPPELGPTSAEIIARANLSGRTAVILTDLSTGEVLEAVDADVAMPPASTLKMVTAAYALDQLTPLHRCQTKLIASHSPREGVVPGDLTLQGDGDPLLDTDALIGLLDQIKAQGLTGANGRFLISNGGLPEFAQIDPGQPVHVAYNPSVAGLNLNFNRVHFQWRRQSGGYRFDLTARSAGFDPPARSVTMRAEGRDWPVFDYHGGSPEGWSVARSALGSGGSRWLPVRRPRQYAGTVFREAAAARSLRISAAELTEARQGGILLASHDSPDLRTILNGMLRFSTNLTAEVMGIKATFEQNQNIDSLAASAERMQFWAARHGLSAHRFVDHSGLGDASRLSPRELTALISRPTIAARLQPIAKPLQLDLNERNITAQVKTGTLNFVSALTGYVPLGNRMAAFTIMSADLSKREGLTRAEREAPPGGAAWNQKAKTLQDALLRRWVHRYG